MKFQRTRKRRSSQHNADVSADNRKNKLRVRFALGAGGLLLAASGSMLTMTSSAQAADCLNEFGQVVACPVPEISALEGTAALAVIAAMVLLMWERRRRA